MEPINLYSKFLVNLQAVHPVAMMILTDNDRTEKAK